MRYRVINLLFLCLMLVGVFTMAFEKVASALSTDDICNDAEKRAAEQQFRSDQDILYFDECSDCSGSSNQPSGVSGAGANCSQTLPDTIPEYWRNLIQNAAATHPDTDPRAVAATLWVENRGWPDPKKNWAASSAGAQGPWQFIPSSWASMGEDCNHDGVKNVNDPEDAVCGAFNHLKGTACKPLMQGATGDSEKDWSTVPYKDEGNNTVISAIQHYNGSGAQSGVPLSQQPHNQNGEYIQMAYWLIASGFTTSYDPKSGQKGDATKSASAGAASATANNNAAAGDAAANCSNAANAQAGVAKVVQINGNNYSFPILLPKDGVTNGYAWPCPGNCHHDGTPAFDLSKLDPDHNPTTGTPVVAITDGEIAKRDESYMGHAGCQSFQLKGNDGYFYWYGHISNASVAQGAQVKAGQQIAVVGDRICTGNGSYSHLHIDRGAKGTYGGSVDNRDPGMVPLINQLYDSLDSSKSVL